MPVHQDDANILVKETHPGYQCLVSAIYGQHTTVLVTINKQGLLITYDSRGKSVSEGFDGMMDRWSDKLMD